MRRSRGGGAYGGSANSSCIDRATAVTVSRPMRSASRRGPIGCPQPSTIPLSMSSAAAKPDSSIRIAASRYGMSSALTTKPARSGQRIAVLPSVAVMNASARQQVSSLVSRLGISSTRSSTGAGLKKWRPMTCGARLVAMASFMIGIEDVLDARMASRPAIVSRAASTPALASAPSRMASMTNSRSANSARSVVNLMALSALSRPAGVSFPAWTARRNERATRSWPARTASSLTSATSTSRPTRAHTSAMPAPMMPEPTTPTRLMSPTWSPRSGRLGQRDSRGHLGGRAGAVGLADAGEELLRLKPVLLRPGRLHHQGGHRAAQPRGPLVTQPVAGTGEETRAEGVACPGGIGGPPQRGRGNRDGRLGGRLDDGAVGAGRGHPGADPAQELAGVPAGLADQQGSFVLVGEQVAGAVDEPAEIRAVHPRDLLGGVGGERHRAVPAGPRVPQHGVRVVRTDQDDVHVRF